MITVNQSGTTIAGTFDSKHLLWLSDIILSEFSCTRQIDEQSAYVFNMPSCDYILILGCDFPCKTGLAVDFSSSLLNAMKPRKYWDDLLSACFILCNEDDCFTTDIKESKYEYVDADEVAAQQKHLSSKQQGELADILCKYMKLLMVLLVGTHTARCILTWNQEQDQYISIPIPLLMLMKWSL